MGSNNFVIITLSFENSGGFLRVSSPELPGLHLASRDFKAVMADVVPAVVGLFKANHGVDVSVVPASDIDTFPHKRPVLEIPVAKDTEHLIAYAAAAA